MAASRKGLRVEGTLAMMWSRFSSLPVCGAFQPRQLCQATGKSPEPADKNVCPAHRIAATRIVASWAAVGHGHDRGGLSADVSACERVAGGRGFWLDEVLMDEKNQLRRDDRSTRGIGAACQGVRLWCAARAAAA